MGRRHRYRGEGHADDQERAMTGDDPMHALSHFSAPVRRWFERIAGLPNPAAGPGLARHRPRRQHTHPRAHRLGQDADRLPVGHRRDLPGAGAKRTASRTQGVRLLYVSPLKALNNDIERNLAARRSPASAPKPSAWARSRRLLAAVAAAARRSPHRRHARHARASMVKRPPAHPDHHARVALPDPDQPARPRHAAQRPQP